MPAHRHALTFVLATLAFVLTACGDERGAVAASVSIDTLPNGTVLVRNDGIGAWDSADAWTITEEVRIGSIEGDGPDVFGSVHDIAVDAYGRVWVLDRQGDRIEVFTRDGVHVRTVGRSGAGPGEIEEATGIAFDPWWRLWIDDPDNGRYTVFDSAGAFVTTHRRRSAHSPWEWTGRFTVDGRLLMEGRRLVEGAFEDVLLALDTAATPLDTFPLPRFEREVYRQEVDGRTRAVVDVPFSPDLVWRTDSEGTLWFGTTGEYRLHRRTLDGDTLRIIDRVYEPLPVTPAEREEVLTLEFYQDLRRQGMELDPERVPEFKPAWSTFTLDDAGYLWVFPTTRDLFEERAADVFDPEGVYLGRVALPDRLRPVYPTPIVRGDRLYGVVDDELGVPYVIQARIDGRPGAR